MLNNILSQTLISEDHSEAPRKSETYSIKKFINRRNDKSFIFRI